MRVSGAARPRLPRFARDRLRCDGAGDVRSRSHRGQLGAQPLNAAWTGPLRAELRQLEAALQKKFSALIASASADIDSHALAADKTIALLFTESTRIAMTAEHLAKAQLRISIGNPPGKSGSLGDAINWESLFEKVPSGIDLVFISGDRDYVSPLKDDSFHSFLQAEWATAKKGKVIFYKRVGSFFKEYFPNSPLATDLEKDALIKDLAESGSFATTHSVITRLSTYSEFSKAQRAQLLDAALTNNQVYLIAEDEDVREFMDHVLAGHEAELDEAKVAAWRMRVTGRPVFILDDSDDEDLPF